MDLCEFETNLVYRISSGTSSKATEKPRLENKKQNKKISTRGMAFICQRQRQVDLYEFEVILVYTVNSKPVRAI